MEFEQSKVTQDYWYGMKPCRECGAPLLDQYPPQRARGNFWHPDVPMSPYEAANLLEALKLVPDTGDWHGQLRFRAQAVLRFYGEHAPNQTAEQMREHTSRGQSA